MEGEHKGGGSDEHCTSRIQACTPVGEKFAVALPKAVYARPAQAHDAPVGQREYRYVETLAPQAI